MDMFSKSGASPLSQQMSPMMGAGQQASPMQQQASPMPQTTDAGSSLKMTISLKQKTPFHLMRSEWPGSSGSEMTVAKNLMAWHGLEHGYMKLTTKKLKATLSSYLSNMPGVMDTPASADNSSLRAIIEKPPVVGKELHSLNQLQLAGFRLHPGPLPEQYRSMAQGGSNAATSRRNSRGHVVRSSRRSSKRGSEVALEEKGEEGRSEERRKKHKRHDKDADERRKRKKEKKKKKYKEDKQEGA